MNALKGRTAIVTGAARGIGAAIARRLAAEGAGVAAVDINAEGITAVAEEIEASGGRALPVVLDVGSEESALAQAVETIIASLGEVQILVNNAALFDPEVYAADLDFASTSLEVWQRTFAVNVFGPALLAKQVAPSMLRSGGGSIVNMASSGAFVGDVNSVAYRTSKAAVVNLTRCMATSHGPKGIRCNAIAPGLIMGPVALEYTPAEKLAMFEKGRLIKDVGRPEDVAELACFLVSDAARYITGQTYAIDGGSGILQSWHALREAAQEG